MVESLPGMMIRDRSVVVEEIKLFGRPKLGGSYVVDTAVIDRLGGKSAMTEIDQ